MIHQYKLNGYNIVLDIYSGSIHVVDDVAYDIISLYEDSKNTLENIKNSILDKYTQINEKDFNDCLLDIQQLEKDSKLFSDDQYKKVASNLKDQKPVVKAMCLHVAHTCNLNCTYCFASQGKYKGERALMSYETGKQALEDRKSVV